MKVIHELIHVAASGDKTYGGPPVDNHADYQKAAVALAASHYSAYINDHCTK